MASEQALRRLVRDLKSGVVSRREFVGRAMALGVGLSTIGLVLTACGKEKLSEKTGTGELGPIEKELNIYNWSDYIAEDTIKNFEKETGIKVRYDNFDNNEILHAKLVAGRTGYEVDKKDGSRPCERPARRRLVHDYLSDGGGCAHPHHRQADGFIGAGRMFAAAPRFGPPKGQPGHG